jgi:hypothetical protein
MEKKVTASRPPWPRARRARTARSSRRCRRHRARELLERMRVARRSRRERPRRARLLMQHPPRRCLRGPYGFPTPRAASLTKPSPPGCGGRPPGMRRPPSLATRLVSAFLRPPSSPTRGHNGGDAAGHAAVRSGGAACRRESPRLCPAGGRLVTVACHRGSFPRGFSSPTLDTPVGSPPAYTTAGMLRNTPLVGAAARRVAEDPRSCVRREGAEEGGGGGRKGTSGRVSARGRRRGRRLRRRRRPPPARRAGSDGCARAARRPREARRPPMR